MKPAFCPPRVREFRVAQVSAPRPGKPVPLSPAESRCVPFCDRISIRPLAWLPAGPTALTHAAAARLKRPTLEIRFASQFFTCHPRDSPGEATIRLVWLWGHTVRPHAGVAPQGSNVPGTAHPASAHATESPQLVPGRLDADLVHGSSLNRAPRSQ